MKLGFKVTCTLSVGTSQSLGDEPKYFTFDVYLYKYIERTKEKCHV